MAEQSTQQQDEQRLVDIILANVGTVVAFRSGSPKDEQLIQPLFNPFVEQGELSNLPAYNFYTRISAIQAQEPLSGETVLLDMDEDEGIAKKAKELSRLFYGKSVTVDEPKVNIIKPDPIKGKTKQTEKMKTNKNQKKQKQLCSEALS